MEGSADGRGGGMVCQYGYVRNVGNMVTLAVDNVKWIGGPWLKYRVVLVCTSYVTKKITGSK